jgi:uncharacterized protein YyaL (SSP411 family)
MSDPGRPTNRLAAETSPYLLQHARNPVDWYPWGEEALARAKAERKPILLSVGYSACHWCHVMERESFEDPSTAALMNEHFINIKVDREERPDVDQVYQTAVQVLGRNGGWPLTMFLTPELKPFFGGTYFPPLDRYGLPSFKRVLDEVARAHREQPAQVDNQADELVQVLRDIEGGDQGAEKPLSREAVEAAAANLLKRFDAEQGGFGRKPKFPNSMGLELWLRSGDPDLVERVLFTLRKMIAGGIYDQLGGGFHRYSTDERWLIPHFEKMLYDNALLLRALAQSYLVTKDEELARAARETVAYVLREMASPEGGFYSTQDADSEGEEGKFFAWTPAELKALLGESDAELFGRVYGVTEEGNFEHHTSVLHWRSPVADAARLMGRDPAEAAQAIERARQVLFEAREKRVHPGRDEKILAGWSGLMMQGLAAVGAAIPGLEDCIAAAERCSEFIDTRMWRDGSLLRTYKDGVAKIPAFAEDYAFVAEAELALFSATGKPVHFVRAQRLVDLALERFADDAGGFFVTPKADQELVVRPKAAYDNAVPSATSSLVLSLLKLHALTGEGRYVDFAEKTLRSFHAVMAKNPFGYTYLWCAFDAAVRGQATLVIMGASAELVAEARKAYLPNTFVLPWHSGVPVPEALASLLEGKGAGAAYLCEGATCSPPVRTGEQLRALLGQ